MNDNCLEPVCKPNKENQNTWFWTCDNWSTKPLKGKEKLFC